MPPYALPPGTGTHSPASPAQLTALEAALDSALPPAYAALLAQTNGLFFSWSNVTLFGAEDIAERNATCEVERYMPGWLLIGSDGGGRGVLIARDGTNPRVLRVGLGVLNLEDSEAVGESLEQWIANGLPVDPEGPQAPSVTRPVDVYLLGMPGKGLEDLKLLREALVPQLPTAELLRKARSGPRALLVAGVSLASVLHLARQAPWLPRSLHVTEAGQESWAVRLPSSDGN